MKALLSVIISAGIIVGSLLLVLALCAPAKVYACTSDCGSDHHNGDSQSAASAYSTSMSGGLSVGETAKAVAVGIAAVAILTCAVRSIWTVATTGRWTWCGTSDRKEPPPDTGPALKVTPDNLSDEGQVYLFKGR